VKQPSNSLNTDSNVRRKNVLSNKKKLLELRKKRKKTMMKKNKSDKGWAQHFQCD